MDHIEAYYKIGLAHLETPEFVRWFETWHGDDSDFRRLEPKLLPDYYNERRWALIGWVAAKLPEEVSSDKVKFVQSLRVDWQAVEDAAMKQSK